MKQSRRTFIRTLAVTGAAAGSTSSPLRAANKSPGETRVLFLVGDYWHNGVMQEKNWRDVLHPAGWQLQFAQDAGFVTPDVLAETDLFVTARYEKTNSLGFSPDRIVGKRADEGTFLTDEREQAIIDNVRRGMGLLAMHCAIWHEGRERWLGLLGVKTPYMHTKVQPAVIHKLNPGHPITNGVESCKIVEDEIFRADLIPGMSTPLFNLKGDEQPIDTTGGWCHDFDKGRVAVLLPGHNPHPFHTKSFKEIMWRSAHWVMHKDIPAQAFENGRPPERSVY